MSFRADFPDVVNRRIAKKRKQHEQEAERQRRIGLLSSKVFVRLIVVCSDLAFNRLQLRKGFNKWLDSLQLQSKAIVRPPSVQNLRKTASKYRAKESESADFRPGSSGQPQHTADHIMPL